MTTLQALGAFGLLALVELLVLAALDPFEWRRNGTADDSADQRRVATRATQARGLTHDAV